MKNFDQRGDAITLSAPYNVASGAGLLVGSIFGVAVTAAGNGDPVVAHLTGVYDLARETGSGSGWSAGDLVYWDDAEKVATLDDDGNTLIGVAVAGTGNDSPTGGVRLNGAFGFPIEET